jgi:hypothetical protein
MPTVKKYLIPFLCMFNVILHLLSIQFLEYHRDELLYFSLSNHLDFGYASVPPFISWMAYLVKSIFGFSLFSIRIIPALMSGVFVYLGARIAKELGGDFYAQVLTIIALICTPFGMRAFMLYQPVQFDVFFWTLIYYIILKYINTSQNKYLYWLGLAMGIAILNKYLVLLQLFSLILVLPFTRYRSLFSNPAFYYSLCLGLMIVSPNIYWQLTHETPLFTHMSALQNTQLQYLEKSEFLIGLGLIFFPSVVFAIIGLLYLSSQQRDKQLGLFSFSMMIVVLTLFYLNGKAYYAAGIFPFLIAAGAVYLSHRIKTSWLQVGVVAFLLALIAPLVPYGLPILPPKQLSAYFDFLDEKGIDVGRIHEDRNKHPLPQDFADMLGWNDIAAYAKEAYDMVEDKRACAIFGENYGIAGAVSLINERYGMPECLSFSGSFSYWIPKKFDPDITSLVYINDELGSDVEALFEKIKIVGSIDDPLSRQYGVTIYLCQEPRRSFNTFWSEVLERIDN